MRLIIFILSILTITSNAFAACEEYPAGSGNWYPGSYASQSLTEADVFSCDDQTGWDAGDTIHLRSGSATWTESTTINFSAIFQGAGVGSTTITLSRSSYYPSLIPDSGSGRRIEFYDFKIVTVGSINRGFIEPTGDNTGNVIFGDMYFDGTSGSQYIISFNNRANGLVYDSTFEKASQPLYFFSSTPILSFQKPLAYGAEPGSVVDGKYVEWTVIEGCDFIEMGCPQTQYDGNTKSAICDASKAGKARFRHNTFYNGYFLNHGSCWAAAGASGTGGYAFEMYDNTHIALDGCYPTFVTEIMAGTFIFYNNIIDERGSGFFQRAYDRCASGSVLCANHFMDVRNLQANRCWSDATWTGIGGTFTTSYVDGASSDTNFYPCDSNHVRGGQSCSKKFCSNSWDVCSNDGDCSGGGTCNRSMDGPDVYFNQTGAGGMVVVDGAAYNEPAPVYFWGNNWIESNADGSNPVDHGENSFNASDDSPSSTFVLNTDLFNSTEMPDYTEATYPDSRRGMARGPVSATISGAFSLTAQ